ncbi:thioredoxin [Candidatus Pacearchaeota archaeon]|nr:thioredoxin [Candidatus Pacearchaeota archaeon]MBD3283233.1 thioredoxin [Candidatus Pacearchaeota archaeon]
MLNLNNENFEKETEKDSVIVDFWAPWCGPCQMMGPAFESLSEKFEKVKFAKMNIDENPEIANKLGIQGIPCLIVLKDGKENGRIVGFMSKDILENKISEILNKS